MSGAAEPQADAFAAQLRGFGAVGVLATLVVLLPGNAIRLGPLDLPLSALLAIGWARLSQTPLAELGFVRPRSWVLEALGGALLGVLLKLAAKALVGPLLGWPEANPAYHALVGNAAALPGMVAVVVIGAGFGEEVSFRGFLFARLRRLFAGRAWALPATVVVGALVFAAAHYADQGLPGAEQALMTGLVFGALYARLGRLWPVMWAHAAFDLTAVAIIYLGREGEVAHLVFR
jgi:membrane protease YdiL (CAAX protease family)